VSKSGEQRSIRWLGAIFAWCTTKRRAALVCGSRCKRVTERFDSAARLRAPAAGQRRAFQAQAERPYPCRWIRRPVYEASQEGSIPSRGATNCPRPRIGRRPSEGRYVEVRLLAGAPPETCWECRSGNADDVRNGRALIRRCYVRSTRTVGTRFPRTHTAVR
jgi:hypothetical protein